MGSNDKPILWVYITHYQPITHLKNYQTRLNYLSTSIFYLSQIQDYRLVIKIISNKEILMLSNLAAPIMSRVDNSTISEYVASEEEITVAGKRLDWLLTWVHKNPMRVDVAASAVDSRDVFLVIEDDAIFTASNLEYFINELAGLRKVGLIPAFIRSEWSEFDQCWTHEDPIGRIIDTAKFFSHPTETQKILMQLQNPFSASIILTHDLAVEYFNSESSVQELACYKHPIIYDIGSSACLGLIMENIPTGYINRVAVICNSVNRFPLPGSVIRHLGDRYAQDKWHKNIRLYDDKDYEALPVHRSKVDYLKRILQRDGLRVVQKYLRARRSQSLINQKKGTHI